MTSPSTGVKPPGPADSRSDANSSTAPQPSFRVEAPQLTLPKGGGALRAIAEKFALNPVTGTGAVTVPIATSGGRSGFGPRLGLAYDSGAGNGPFGLGWTLPIETISRKTDKGLPQYDDEDASDVFILSGSEDLVPVLVASGGAWRRDVFTRTVYGQQYEIRRYRPRVEGLFARIERWTNRHDPRDMFWRSISRENVTTWYGRTPESRIADPADPRRIFSWQICETYDDKGNVAVYTYKREDSAGVDTAAPHEQNRTPLSRSAKQYVKHIFYGNRTPYFPDLTAPSPVATPTDWCFEVVFDYGEHDPLNPTPQDRGQWPVRVDPYSTYRPAFEVRSYRLCHRVLMFHHFPDEPDVGVNCLVRSTDFTYSPQPSNPVEPVYSFLQSVAHTGYRRHGASGYASNSLPPVEFEFSAAAIDETVREIDRSSLDNLPYGAASADYQWVDLDGEGLQGILTEQAGAWFYKPNLSPANQHVVAGEELTIPRFAPLELLTQRPAAAALAAGGQRLMDLSGDGQLDVVDFEWSMPGFYERTPEAQWNTFTAFTSLPNLDWADPNIRFLDLTGDGLPDLLITDDEAFYWHASLGEDGFDRERRLACALDEEKGPKALVSDADESVFIADMSGDGMVDLVRVRNGRVSYWPNLGFGRFGAKIVMDTSPWFDHPDQFDSRRIQFADIDGSGTSDIVYFAADRVDLYFNRSGNGFGEPRTLRHFPPVDSASSATVVDLLGSGTACLVWSSLLPGHANAPMRYIDLMAAGKPHMLVRVRNNMGAETAIHYCPSTKFYVADKLAGTPWVTRLPFPVHVVDEVRTYDYVNRTLAVTQLAYHHGHFDGRNREFCGFGRVDQWDTEQFASLTDSGEFPAPTNIDEASHVPPVRTTTWYHTGADFGRGRISRYLAQEYYAEGDPATGQAPLSTAQRDAMLLADTVLPETVLLPDGTRARHAFTPEEQREACRALRGSMLRQEIYGIDGTSAQHRPYRVTERNYTIEALQPEGPNAFAVFYTHARETVDFEYERTLLRVNADMIVPPDTRGPAKYVCDPRVTHAFVFNVDAFGNVLRSSTVNYGRRYTDPDLSIEDQMRQRATAASFSDSCYSNAILQQLDDYRSPAPAEAKAYELLQITPVRCLADITNMFGFDELDRLIDSASDGAHDVAFEDVHPAGLNAGQPYRRALTEFRTYYRPDDLGATAGDTRALLPLGALEPQAISGSSYQLALTPSLIATTYIRDGTALLPDPAAVLASAGGDGGGYVDLDGDGRFWTPSGRTFYTAEPAYPTELEHARQNFYLARRFEDPFGTPTLVDYDTHNLLVTRTTDAKANTIAATNDYRVLARTLITDANANRAAASFDTLGFVAATAVMGKTTETRGDLPTGFPLDLTPSQTDALYDSDDPAALAGALLGNATSRIVYDVTRFHRTRQAAPNDPSKWLPAFSAALTRETHVSDLPAGAQSAIRIGFGYSDGFGREIQRKIQAEPGPVADNGPTIDPRWVGTGWTIYNNKGKPVREYEPFFSQLAKGHQFEFAHIVGVSAIVCYDPAERPIATIHPNHTYAKVVFDPWRQETWDGNDTVLQDDPTADPDVGSFFARLPEHEYSPTWRVQRANGELGPEEQTAAERTVAHAETPAVAHFDAQGRAFLRIADNGADGEVTTRADIDIQGNQRAMIDAAGRTVLTVEYNMAGKPIHQSTMDGGQRWTLNDTLDTSIRAWDTRGHQLRSEYDELRRPLRFAVQGTDAAASDPRTLWHEIIFEQITYGEGQANDQGMNIRTRAIEHRDTAGVVRNVIVDPDTGSAIAFDFKGNSLGTSRQFLDDYTLLPDWSHETTPALDAATHVSTARYDALNRVIEARGPDGSIVRPTFNTANLLERLDVNLLGADTATAFVSNIDYDAKGRRTTIEYGAPGTPAATTSYGYDPLTFRLTQQKTMRPHFPTEQQVAQDLAFTYDPIGNITHIADQAQQTIYFNNRRVEPSTDYTYDPLYRLTTARGREHLGLTAATPEPPRPTSYNDVPRIRLARPGDGNAMGTYYEEYDYDKVGNLTSVHHRGSHPAHPGWTRSYVYNEPSLLEPTKFNNRLTHTIAHGSVPLNEPYTYDAHGNMATMPQIQATAWDFRDQLTMTRRQAVNADDTEGAQHDGERTYYIYDAAGQRVRKVTESAAGVKTKERLYLGTVEIYREYDPTGAATTERQTLHVMDDKHRIALVETPADGQSAIRFQFDNQIGSACLELDDNGAVITYEEYYPYGSTSYQAGRTAAETSLKRYRYTAKERDEETGLSYHGARYYAPWLGRWLNPDPIGVRGGINVYTYCHDNPISRHDPQGTQDDTTTGVGITISGNGVQVGPITIQGPGSTSTAPLPPLPQIDQPSNLAEDLFLFIRNQAGFIEGMPKGRTPQKFGQDAHSRQTTFLGDLKAAPPDQRLKDVDRVYSEPRIVNGAVTQIGGKPGGPKGALNPDLVAVQKGATLNVGDADVAQKTEAVGDSKFGGGTIAKKYGALGGRQVTVNGVTNSADTDPNLLKPATPQGAPTATTPATSGGQPSTGTSGGTPTGSTTGTKTTTSPAAPQPEAEAGTAPSTSTQGTGRAPSTFGQAGAGVLGGIGRAVPFVAEGEAALMGAAGLAAQSPVTVGLVSPLMTAAEALPVAAGVGVVGAGAGHAVRVGLEKAGVDKDTATGIGFGAAVATGAALGTVIPGVGNVAGAVIGGLVAGAFYLFSLW